MMTIKAITFRKDGFYGQPFAFGGEDGPEKFDPNVRYRGALTNYLIDTGDEVILVDTGLPAGTPEEAPDEKSPAFTGRDVGTYMSQFAALGYKPEQVTKILLTHKHADHSGELKSFPNAKIYVNADEVSADELKGLGNLVPVTFTDGPYYNFPASQKIRDGIYYIKAKGHTNGNSIVIVELDGLFYMIHGDITYVDEALYANKLSVVYDDKAAARETLDRVREFIRNHPTVYVSTHTPPPGLREPGGEAGDGPGPSRGDHLRGIRLWRHDGLRQVRLFRLRLRVRPRRARRRGIRRPARGLEVSPLQAAEGEV